VPAAKVDGQVSPFLVAQFYDQSLSYLKRHDVPFFVGMAKRHGGPVLELACGTGRVLIPIVRAGIEVTGLDFSSSMLSICRQKLARAPAEARSKARLVRADMRRFHLRRWYRQAFIPYYSFQLLLTVKDQLACLKSVGWHLVSGGRLVLDLFNPNVPRMMERQNRVFGNVGPRFKLADGRIVTRRVRFSAVDTHRQLVEIESVSYVKHPGGHRERLAYPIRLRFLYRFEAEHLLARAGFRLEKVYGDYDWSPYRGQESKNLILVAEKM
jgi:SAM-dependent methyltransferase